MSSSASELEYQDTSLTVCNIDKTILNCYIVGRVARCSDSLVSNFLTILGEDNETISTSCNVYVVVVYCYTIDVTLTLVNANVAFAVRNWSCPF